MLTKFEEIAEGARQNAEKIIKEMKDGKSNGIGWSDDFATGKVTLKEMITSEDGGKEFLEKITYDLYQGREDVPILYKSIYTTLTDANFPKTITANEMGPVQVVFLETLETEEVSFGVLAPGTKKVVEFKTYSAGIQYTEDMIEYNSTWEVSEISKSFGEAYNKLLNHLHLGPIVTASYTTTGGGLDAQKAAQKAGIQQLIAYDTSIAKTLRSALSVLPNGKILVINSADQFALEDAIAGAMLADKSPAIVKRRLSPNDFVVYDGDSVTVGPKTYTYPGVTAGTCYLVSPNKKNFKEYIKHDLRVDSDNADLSRLIKEQIVGRARRAVLAGLGGKDGVVKINLA